jgi:hypothetical protein
MSEIAESYEKVYGIKAKVVVKGSAKELYDHMWQVRNQNEGQVHKYLSMYVLPLKIEYVVAKLTAMIQVLSILCDQRADLRGTRP